MSEIHINIRGGCVLRDILSFNKEKSEYIVDRFTQTISPVSAVESTKILSGGSTIDDTGLFDSAEFSNLKSFIKRNFVLDIERKVFDYIFECRSDYLIIDMSDCRFDLIKFSDGVNTSYLTKDVQWYKDAVLKLKRLGCIDMDYVFVTSDEEIFSLMEKCLPVYLKKLMEYYPLERIILVELLPVDFYINGNDEFLFKKDPKDKYYKRISYAYKIAKNVLKGCYVVEFPNYVIGDRNHKWGLLNMHYTKEYYDYGFEAFEIIMREHNEKSDKEYKLKELKDKYSMIYYEKYKNIFIENIENNQRKIKILQNHCDYFKELLTDQKKFHALLDYMLQKGYKRCAFYGWSRITDVYTEILKKEGIQIDYIVETSNKEKLKGIPVIGRNSVKYPETDVIIVSDIIFMDKIKEKLPHITNIPFVDVLEVLE